MKQSLLTIEINDSYLKVLTAKFTGKGWSSGKYAAEITSGKSEDEIIALLKESVKKLHLKKAHVALVVPRSMITVRYLELPTNKSEELKSMIDMQAVRQMPYSREEMVYDYHITGINNEGSTKVLLAIAHRDTIARYLRILEKAGLVPEYIELDSLAIAALCGFIKEKDPSVIDEQKTTAVLDIDNSATNMVIMKNGVPVFTRSFSIGVVNLKGSGEDVAKKDYIAEWALEVNRSISVFQKEQGTPIEKIVFIGAQNEEFVAKVSGRINADIKGYSPKQYLEGFNVDEIKDFSIAGLLGVIKEGLSSSVNLIPDDVKKTLSYAQNKQSVLTTAILFLCIIGVLGFTFNKKIQDRREYLSILGQRLKETSPSAKELMLKKDRLSLIKKQLSVDGTSLDVLREMYNIIPQKTALNVFIYDENQGVTIKGASPAMSEVFDLIPKLENSPYFENVTSRYATQRKIKGQELTEFHIDCSISKSKEQQND